MRISKRALDTIVKHAKDVRPFECCGFMMAEPADRQTVTWTLPAENEEKDNPENRFQLGHKAYLEAAELEASQKAAIAGIYHSHPNGNPRPSDHDRELAVEGPVYLIVALNGEGVTQAAWTLEGEEFAGVPLEVYV